MGEIRADENSLVFGAAEGEERPFEQEDRIALGTMMGGADYSSSDGLRVETTIPPSASTVEERTIPLSKRADFLAAALTEAVEIWRDRGAPESSAREEVTRRFPEFIGLQGMLEKADQVRCALDVGESQVDEVSLHASLLNAVEAVRVDALFCGWSWGWCSPSSCGPLSL